MADGYSLSAEDFSYRTAVETVKAHIRTKQGLETDDEAMAYWEALSNDDQLAVLKEALTP